MKHLRTFRLFENSVELPVIKIIVPNSDEILKQSNISIQAKISNVNDASNITLKVNGVEFQDFRFETGGLNDFRFDEDANFVANYVKLKAGINEITITCQNDFGIKYETITVEHDKEFWKEIQNITFSEDGMGCSIDESNNNKYVTTGLETIAQNKIELVLTFFKKELSKKKYLDIPEQLLDIKVTKVGEGEVVKLIFNQMMKSSFSFCKDDDDRYFAIMNVNQSEFYYKCFDFVGLEKCLIDGIDNWVRKYYITL
jgi:hypothetical protein